MCGIAGWLSATGKAPDHAIVGAMTRTLARRGPDVEAIVLDGPLAFGHRRLSVIDLSAASNQPMWDRTGRYLLVFNGEIYNFRVLRGELEQLGHVFTTQGDGEVLLEAFRAWGPAALGRFVGMFAFALWDKERKSLLLARDRLGKKPMFFARLPGGGLAFASEPRALAVHPDVRDEIDRGALAQYLRLNYVPCHRSLYAGIESLPPASYAEIDAGRGLRITRYWDLAQHFHAKRKYRSGEEAADELRELIDDAVRLRMISDVPLGAFLSGGVDSSTIAASMVRHAPASSVHTFSSGFVEDSFDESAVAEQTARRLGAVHRTQTLDPRAIDLLPAVLAAADEPLADTSALPMYFLSGFTRQHVTVALSGDGGDECFGGYETYVADKLHRMLTVMPLALRSGLASLAPRLLPVDHRKVGWAEKLRRFSAALPYEPSRAHASWRDIFRADELASVMHGDWRAESAGRDDDCVWTEYFEPHFRAVEGCHPLDQATYVDLKTWLPDDILVKADRMSMAHSLEVRCPLLDHRIVEFAAALPPALKLRGFSKKHVLRESQRGRLPDAVLDAPKRGFNAPVSQWLLGSLRPLCADVLFSAQMSDWFDAAQVRRLWQEHEKMRHDHGLKLFGLLCLALFLQSRGRHGSPATTAPARHEAVDASVTHEVGARA